MARASTPYKVKITVGDATVEVEGGESGVVKIVEAVAEVLRGGRKSAGSMSPGPALTPAPTARASVIDVRSFFDEKKPSSDVEAAAVAAYYYQYLAPPAERRDTIDSALVETAFRLARRPLPKRTIYTLQNARNAGYLDAAGATGQYRLNPVGYNLVEHTLGQPGKTAEGRVGPRRRGRRGGRTAKGK